MFVNVFKQKFPFTNEAENLNEFFKDINKAMFLNL